MRRSIIAALCLGALAATAQTRVKQGPGMSLPVLNAKGFGAVGDGIKDDTSALQGLFNRAAAGGGIVYLPTGVYAFTSLTLRNWKALQITGDGNRSSILRYTGAAGGTAILLLNCYRTVWRGIRTEAVANQPAILVEVREDHNQGDYDSTAPSQLNRFEESTFKNGGVGVAIDLPAGAVAGDDIMNDSHIFDHNIMDGQTVANVQITGANALNVGFRDNYFTGAPVAVQVLNAPAGGGGTFNWRGGYVASTSINFDIQNTGSDGYLISKVRSESSPRFLSVGSTAVSSPIVLEGDFYSAANLNADGHAINMLGGGPLTVVGGTYGSSSSGTAPNFNVSTPSPTTVILQGVAFESPGSDVAARVVGANFRVSEIGSRLKTSGLARVVSVDTVPTSTEGFVAVPFATGSGVSLGAVDVSVATSFRTVATTNLQFGWDNPINAKNGQLVRFMIKNTSGGALSAATPFAGTKFRSGPYTPPLTTKNRTYTFIYDATADVFYEMRPDVDIGN